jgi:hypothetical protein
MANDPKVSAPAGAQTAAPAATPTVEQLLVATLAQLAQANQQNAESNARIATLMEAQAKHNDKILKIAPRRRKSMQEYLAEKKQKGQLKFLRHDVYQNGRLVRPNGLSQATIDVLDTLNTGSYSDGAVDVIRIRDGVDGRNSRIHIMYNNKTIEERMMFYMKFPTFTKIVETIAAEMKARDIAFVNEVGQDPPEFEFPEEL